MSVFQQIRDRTSWVMDQAEFVRRDELALSRLADHFLEEARAGSQDPVHRPLHSPEATLAHVVLLDAINFGSGWFPYLRKPVEASGYKTVARALRSYCEQRGVPDAAQLAIVTPEQCAEVFGQSGNTDVAALMELFARSWNDLGRLLLESYAGRFENLIESARASAAKLVQLLADMPLYRDVSRYRGVDVPFYKRAQITCADLHVAFDGEGWGHFEDIDELTLFADNLVPHVLRWEGVLSYHPSLLRRIARQECLVSGSPEEVEIRAAAVDTVEAMSRLLRDRGASTPPRILDHWLWQRGQSPLRKASPRHRTRCAYY